MLYTIGTNSVQHRKRCDTQMGQEVCNIENDVIHKRAKKCITSKIWYKQLGQEVYNIENDVIHNWQPILY